MTFEHYLTYQHNVQKYFHHHADKYTGIVIPMSIAVAFAGGTYGFIRALCSRDSEKRYGIDPRTPLFQKSWDRSNVRPPHEKVADELGPPFSDEGLTNRVEPSHFDTEEELTAAVIRCLNFQLQFRMREEDERKLKKYKKLLGIEGEELHGLREPQFLVPPYFQFDSTSDDWFDVNRRAVRIACLQGHPVPIRPVLHFRDWGSVESWSETVGEMKARGANELWLYPNNFHEHDASLDALQSYQTAVLESGGAGVRVFSLFGGYYAILMSAYGLSGFANGVGYGEWRDSGYHRGGSALLRIYIPQLHRYLDVPAAENLVEQDPEHFAGGDDLIATCVAEDRPLDDPSQEEWLDHFMACRQAEINFVLNEGIDAARDQLQTTLARLDEIGELEREQYGDSLERWIEATG